MNNHKKCIMAVAVVEGVPVGVPVPVIIMAMAMATATGIVNFLKLK